MEKLEELVYKKIKKKKKKQNCKNNKAIIKIEDYFDVIFL